MTSDRMEKDMPVKTKSTFRKRRSAIANRTNKSNERLDHYFSHGYSLDQCKNGVLVTFPDGTTRRVLNARLTRESVQNILNAATKPANFRPPLPSSVLHG